MSRAAKQKKIYYNLSRILETGAQYCMIIGERSNGKSYAVLEYALRQYVETGEQLALVRRWAEDLRGNRAQQIFSGLVNNGVVTKLTGGEWDYIHYYSGCWYLARDTEDGKRETEKTPFAYRFVLSSVEHDKSTSYPNVGTIFFDEFIAMSGYYLPDEFTLFCNAISTIVRLETKARIFMVGNTVSKFSPYFKEMGLNKIKQMQPGTIDLYTYGQSGLMVAVEFSDFVSKKESDVYFAFENPKLQMITGKGSVWQLEIYPHAPCKWAPKDIIFRYFVKFDGEFMQCECISVNNTAFIYVHRKTGELKKPDEDLIYSPEWDPRPNWRRFLTRPTLPVEQSINHLHAIDKVYFQDNEVGELYNQYIRWSKAGGKA